jgi:hypothetical protein
MTSPQGLSPRDLQRPELATSHHGAQRSILSDRLWNLVGTHVSHMVPNGKAGEMPGEPSSTPDRIQASWSLGIRSQGPSPDGSGLSQGVSTFPSLERKSGSQ